MGVELREELNLVTCYAVYFCLVALLVASLNSKYIVISSKLKS